MRRTTEQHDPIEIEQLYRGLDAEDTASAVSVILKLQGRLRIPRQKLPAVTARTEFSKP